MRRLILSGALSLLALWGGYTIFVLWGSNYKAVIPDLTLRPANSSWQMLSGLARQMNGSWVVTSQGHGGRAVVGVSVAGPEPVSNYDRIVVELGQDIGNRSMRLGWS